MQKKNALPVNPHTFVAGASFKLTSFIPTAECSHFFIPIGTSLLTFMLVSTIFPMGKLELLPLEVMGVENTGVAGALVKAEDTDLMPTLS